MMDIKDFFSKETLARITDAAPFIGAILGPGGAAAGAAIKMIAGALGVEATPPAIETALQNNPEALLKIRDLELSHKLDWERLLLEAEKVRLADVQSARDREVKIVQATGKRDLSQEILGWIITAGFFIVLGMRLFITVPTDQLENVGMLIGALITAFTTVVQYRYGSSKGSADKSAAINMMTGKNSN
jgi:hypothetical protein